jgi:hypothetical protein
MEQRDSTSGLLHRSRNHARLTSKGMTLSPTVSVTGEQVARTRQVWQPRIGRELTHTDAHEIMHNVTGFFGVLAEWARAEKMAAPASDSASPKEGEVRHER